MIVHLLDTIVPIPSNLLVMIAGRFHQYVCSDNNDFWFQPILVVDRDLLAVVIQ
jgi:hypothetical protein